MTGTTMERATQEATALVDAAGRAGLGPVAVPAPPDAVARALAARIVAGEVVAPARRRAPLAPRTLLPALATATASVAVAVVAVVALQPAAPAQAGPPRLEFSQDGGELRPTSGVAPQEDLGLLASAAASSSVPGPSETATVQEVVTAGWGAQADDDDPTTPFVTVHTQVRTDPTGAVTIHQERGEPLTEDGRGIDPTSGWTPPQSGTDALPSATLDATLVAGLPSDPAALRQQLDSLLGCDQAGVDSSAVCLVQAVEYVYTFTVVPADVEAGLWEMLADTPGVVSLGAVEDRAGRAGIGIAAAAPARGEETMTVLVGDSATGELLGSEHLLFPSDAPDDQPRVVEFVTFLSRAWVPPAG